MKRRDFVASSLAAAGSIALSDAKSLAAPPAQQPQNFPSAPGLTKYVAEFIVNTRYEDIPAPVIELGKKSLLDGFGLALAGSVSDMGPLIRQYVQSQGATGKASIIGSNLKAARALGMTTIKVDETTGAIDELETALGIRLPRT